MCDISVKYNGEEIDKFDLIYNSELTFSLKKYLLENIIIVIVGMFIIIKLFGIFKK